MCANNDGSGETARMRRLSWAFAGRLRDKYHNLMSWFIYSPFNNLGETKKGKSCASKAIQRSMLESCSPFATDTLISLVANTTDFWQGKQSKYDTCCPCDDLTRVVRVILFFFFFLYICIFIFFCQNTETLFFNLYCLSEAIICNYLVSEPLRLHVYMYTWTW